MNCYVPPSVEKSIEEYLDYREADADLKKDIVEILRQELREKIPSSQPDWAGLLNAITFPRSFLWILATGYHVTSCVPIGLAPYPTGTRDYF